MAYAIEQGRVLFTSESSDDTTVYEAIVHSHTPTSILVGVNDDLLDQFPLVEQEHKFMQFVYLKNAYNRPGINKNQFN